MSLSPTNKKYIKEFGPAACLFAAKLEQEDGMQCQWNAIHVLVCERYSLPFKPFKHNLDLKGRGMVNAGRQISQETNNFRAKYGILIDQARTTTNVKS